MFPFGNILPLGAEAVNTNRSYRAVFSGALRPVVIQPYPQSYSYQPPPSGRTLMGLPPFPGVGRYGERVATRVMLLVMVGVLIIGIDQGRLGVIITTSIALVVTQVPALLKRAYQVEVSPWLALWLTTAVFLHAIGTAGLPGTGGYLYGYLPWWDHLTHATSASVVAATGYIVVRSIDLHSETVHLPHRFVFVVLLVFVMAAGVVWELLEFAVGTAPELAGRTRTGFAQRGIEDTVLDTVYNAVGGIVVGAGGYVYLNESVASLQQYLDRHRKDSQ